MNIKFIEFELEWPEETSVSELRNLILSKLLKHGDPLRWAISSLSNKSKDKGQTLIIDAVFIVNKDKQSNQDIYSI